MYADVLIIQGICPVRNQDTVAISLNPLIGGLLLPYMFVLGVNAKYRLFSTSLLPYGGYTGERVNIQGNTQEWMLMSFIIQGISLEPDTVSNSKTTIIYPRSHGISAIYFSPIKPAAWAQEATRSILTGATLPGKFQNHLPIIYFTQSYCIRDMYMQSVNAHLICLLQLIAMYNATLQREHYIPAHTNTQLFISSCTILAIWGQEANTRSLRAAILSGRVCPERWFQNH